MATLDPRNYVANEAGLRKLTEKHGALPPGPEHFFGPSEVVIQAPYTGVEEKFAAQLTAWTKQAELDGNILCRQIIGAWRYDFEHGLREPWSPVERLLLDVWHGRLKYDDLMWQVENESTKLMTEDMVEYYFDHLGSWVDEYEAAVRLVEKYAEVGGGTSPDVTLTDEEQQALATCISSLDSGFRSTGAAVDPSDDNRFKLRPEELSVIDKAIGVLFERHGRKFELPFQVIAQNVYKSWLYAMQTSSPQRTTRQGIIEFHRYISRQNSAPSELRTQLEDCRRFLIGAVRKEQLTPSNTERLPPFLGLALDIPRRTVRRQGYEVSIAISGDVSWPLLLKLVEARGRELTDVEVAKLPGSSKAPARRKQREALNLALYSLKVSIPEAGWVLKSVR